MSGIIRKQMIFLAKVNIYERERNNLCKASPNQFGLNMHPYVSYEVETRPICSYWG